MAAPRPAVSPRMDETPPSPEPSFLCSPQTQLRHPRQCPPAGPSNTRAELARQGLSPLRPLPISTLDLNLGYLPFSYRRLESDGTRVYSSAGDAAAGAGAAGGIDSGFVYISWSECQVINDTAVYLTAAGYIRGGSECKQIAMPSFHGLTFSRTPSRTFGWVLARPTSAMRRVRAPRSRDSATASRSSRSSTGKKPKT